MYDNNSIVASIIIMIIIIITSNTASIIMINHRLYHHYSHSTSFIIITANFNLLIIYLSHRLSSSLALTPQLSPSLQHFIFSVSILLSHSKYNMKRMNSLSIIFTILILLPRIKVLMN
jgi:hypothetical protein